MKCRAILLIFALCACGQPLQNIQTMPTEQVTPRANFAQEPVIEELVTQVPAQITEQIDENPRPVNQLGTEAWASFDPNKSPDIDVHGRHYTLLECVQYSCMVELWPDHAQVWVSREAVGLEKFVPTPVTIFVKFTPVPKPPCATFNGPAGSVTVCGWGDLTQQGQDEYIRQYGGNVGQPGQPGECSACP